MSIPVICPCGKQLRAKDSHAGRKARCPRCKNPVAIPLFHSPKEDDSLAAPGLGGGWLKPMALALIFTIPAVFLISAHFRSAPTEAARRSTTVVADPTTTVVADPTPGLISAEPVRGVEVAVKPVEVEAQADGTSDVAGANLPARPEAVASASIPAGPRLAAESVEAGPSTAETPEGPSDPPAVAAPSSVGPLGGLAPHARSGLGRRTGRVRRWPSFNPLDLPLGLGFDSSRSGGSSYSGGGTVHVRGYTRKNGTYVAPHTRSAPRRR